MNLHRQTFQNAGLTLSYVDNQQASDLPPVVMLHGFTASAQLNWVDSGWVQRLTEAGRRVIAIDARGHGDSDKPHDRQFYPSNVMMADSVALLNQLGIEKADYAGFSMGARMATFVAIHYPDKVRKLLIGGLGIHLITGIGNSAPIAEALLAENPNSVKNRHARRFRLFAEKNDNDLQALACCILSSRQPITAALLRKVAAKTLILVGEEDTTGGNPDELQPFIANSQAQRIAGCNHFNALTHEAFRSAGVAFLLAETADSE